MSSKVFLNRVQSVLKANKVDALIIEKPMDLFYLTGLHLSLGTLVISKGGGTLFVDGRYLSFAKKKGPFPSEKMSNEALSKKLNSFQTVGFDSYETSYARWQQLKGCVKNKLVPLHRPTLSTRAIKSTSEIKALKKSASLLWKGFQFLKKKLKVGITEQKAAALFEVYCLEQGAQKMAFDPIVAFGKNTGFPHHKPGSSRLKKGDIVLLDLGVVVEGYHSDMTRTFFYGKPHANLILLESVVREAHAAALKLCRPGTKIGDLDRAATEVIQKADLTKFLAHSLGHGVGLEIHEFPRIKSGGEDADVLLKEGMVITIEPGLYGPGMGGVRHEDTIVITQKGYENFYPV